MSPDSTCARSGPTASTSRGKVLAWYGEFDGYTPPAHGRWLAEFSEAETRALGGFGHADVAAAAVVDVDEYLEWLVATAPELDKILPGHRVFSLK